MFNITSKLEINIRRSPTVGSDTQGLNILVVKNRVPAIVVDPEFIQPMFFERTKVNGTYKIITTVDFYNGALYGMDKLRDLPRFALESDGLEVLITPNKNDKESLNELKTLSEFLRKINPLMQIRWVLGLRTRSFESVAFSLSHMKNWPCSFIRTDPNITSPGSNLEKHKLDISNIRSKSGLPIKLSGNINIETIREFPAINRFDVSVIQFKAILKALKENPELAAPKAEVKIAPVAPKPELVATEPEPDQI